jgi:hypothetical protein
MQKKPVDFEDGFGWIAQYILAENGAEVSMRRKNPTLSTFFQAFVCFKGRFKITRWKSTGLEEGLESSS